MSGSTLRDFEAGRRVPIANNLAAIRRALEEAGMQLLFGGSDDRPLGVAKRQANEADPLTLASTKRASSKQKTK